MSVGQYPEPRCRRSSPNSSRKLTPSKGGSSLYRKVFADSTVKRLLNVVGGQALVEDPGFSSPQHRVANVNALEEIICARLKQNTQSEVLDIFDRVDVVGCDLYVIRTKMDPQYLHWGDIVHIKDPGLDDVTVRSVVPKFSDTPGEVTHLGIPLGQSNRNGTLRLGKRGTSTYRSG